MRLKTIATHHRDQPRFHLFRLKVDIPEYQAKKGEVACLIAQQFQLGTGFQVYTGVGFGRGCFVSGSEERIYNILEYIGPANDPPRPITAQIPKEQLFEPAPENAEES